MQVRAGTSGFSYKEWKGPFYPEKLPANKMLGFYAERLSTVEINSSFYRMPKASMLQGWADKVPEGFVFVLKASRKITHSANRLADVDDAVQHLWKVAGELGSHLGPFLFQLPPFFKKDVELLSRFMDGLPVAMRAAFEFRHESWFDEDTFAALREAGKALCVAETDETERPELVSTTDWGYLRLRREDYTDDALGRWRKAVDAQPWKEAFVFFKHEDKGSAPKLASRFAALG